MTNSTIAPFGRTPEGAPVEAVALDNGAGLRARVITYGASLQSLVLPDGTDVVLGYDSLAPYIDEPVYIGAAIGRYANRIADGAFELDGKRYALARSDGPNTLHGGARGFDKRVWRLAPGHAENSVTLHYRAPDGEEGFPGALDARVTYALTGPLELTVTFEAETDAPTVVSLTQHSYFNLAGAASGEDILAHELTIDADAYTPVNEVQIPTGEVRALADTPFDFRTPHPIGTRIAAVGGYDHNFVLRGGVSAAPRLAARLAHPASGRSMALFTTEPGLQFYSGNFLRGVTTGKGGRVYGRHAGLCLEPQYFPDSPNRPAFPSPRLDPGRTYRHVSIYRFATR